MTGHDFIGADLFSLAQRVHSRLRVRADGPPAVVLIDGRSGSGKTSLATGLARLLGAQTLPVEHLYPGWDGLDAGSAALPHAVDAGHYRRYDWHARGFAERIDLDPARPLVIEGCGALSAESLAAALRRGASASASDVPAPRRVHAIWVACPAGERRRRALARDGDMFRPHWEAWAAQERARFARARPLGLAHEIVHTASAAVSAPASPGTPAAPGTPDAVQRSAPEPGR